MENWIPHKLDFSQHICMFLFAGLVWVIWTTRNKMAIEHKFRNKATEVVFHVLSFVQKWMLLLKPKDRQSRKDHGGHDEMDLQLQVIRYFDL